jgi:hypothetical protein
MVAAWVLLVFGSAQQGVWAQDGAASEPEVKAPDAAAEFIKHRSQMIEGWRVEVDERLLDGEQAELGQLGLRVLANKLFEITQIVPADRVAKLRQIPIFVDYDHPLNNMQYHPDEGWLRANGYDPVLTRAVHIPRVQQLINNQRNNRMPMVVLHELAHGYHDQFLDFDNKSIIRAFTAAQASKRYEKVLLIDGGKVRHYGLTNHKEYFAELTESYFGTNDFYPFVKSELAEFDPEGHALMESVWRKKAEPEEQ